MFPRSNTTVSTSYKHIQQCGDANQRFGFCSLKNRIFLDFIPARQIRYHCYVLPGPIHPLIFRLQTTERMVKMPASNFRNHSRYCYYVPIQLFYQAISIFSNAGTVVEQYNFRVWKIGFPPDLRGDRLHLLLWCTILGLPRRHLPIPASTPLRNHKNARFKL